MEQRITHACGHEQAHYFTGFSSQQERKARWLETTSCRACFVAAKQLEQADAAARHTAVIAHLDLQPLCGSERQISWAATIRAGRLAALTGSDAVDDDRRACLLVTDAKWWIDHRDLTDVDLIAKARVAAVTATIPTDATKPASIAQAA